MGLPNTLMFLTVFWWHIVMLNLSYSDCICFHMYLAVERSFQPMQTYSSAGFQNPNCKFLSVDGTVDWLHAD